MKSVEYTIIISCIILSTLSKLVQHIDKHSHYRDNERYVGALKSKGDVAELYYDYNLFLL